MKKNPLMKFIIAAENDASKKALEANRRGDSLSAEQISKLYDLDVNKNGKRNIVEEAHPETLVAFDSYDKLNGILKNDNEAQDITINILNRKQTGFLVYEKLASQSALINSLVKAANFLDSRDPALSMYCDKILVELDKSFKKEAFLPAGVLAGVLIPAGIVGVMYWQQHSDTANRGLVNNLKALDGEIKDIVTDSAYLTGRDYNKVFKEKLIACRGNIAKIVSMYSQLRNKITAFTFPETGEELMKLSQDVSSQEIITQFNEFKKTGTNLFEYLTDLKESLSNEEMKAMQVTDKGYFTELVDRAKVFSGGSGFIKDDIDDVLAMVGPVKQSLLDTFKIMDEAREKSNKVLELGRQNIAPDLAKSMTKVKPKAPSDPDEAKAGRSMESFVDFIKSK